MIPPDIKSLPQWAQVYIRKLLFRIETLEHIVRQGEHRAERVEQFFRLLKELSAEIAYDR